MGLWGNYIVGLFDLNTASQADMFSTAMYLYWNIFQCNIYILLGMCTTDAYAPKYNRITYITPIYKYIQHRKSQHSSQDIVMLTSSCARKRHMYTIIICTTGIQLYYIQYYTMQDRFFFAMINSSRLIISVALGDRQYTIVGTQKASLVRQHVLRDFNHKPKPWRL